MKKHLFVGLALTVLTAIPHTHAGDFRIVGNVNVTSNLAAPTVQVGTGR